MDSSTHLELPYILPEQAQKHVTHNEAIAALDTLTQLAVLDRDLGTPPADPTLGDRYIVGPAAAGAWAGKPGQVAAWDGAAWRFHVPAPGWLAYVVDEKGLLVWDGLAWGLPLLGINTAADSTNRLSVKADAVLLGHDDVTPGSGDMRLKLDKAGPGGTASLLYQTGFSGRAEIGTAGDDRLHVKVSPDGSTWHEALVVDPATGFAGFGQPVPVARLDVEGTVRVRAYTVAGLPGASAGAGQIAFVSDEVGGAVLAFSDGVNWRRVTDRAVVS